MACTAIQNSSAGCWEQWDLQCPQGWDTQQQPRWLWLNFLACFSSNSGKKNMGWHVPRRGHCLLLHQADSPGNALQLSLASFPLPPVLSHRSRWPRDRPAKTQQVHGQAELPSSYPGGWSAPPVRRALAAADHGHDADTRWWPRSAQRPSAAVPGGGRLCWQCAMPAPCNSHRKVPQHGVKIMGEIICWRLILRAYLHWKCQQATCIAA